MVVDYHATNTTAHAPLVHSPHQQEASGWSIFWALTAIVVNSMLQVSFTGYIWNGDAFEGSLWPHRSSPFICLLDAAADVWIGIRALSKSGADTSGGVDHDDKNEDTVRPGILTKLALFFLGVVPQAIKLFSMKGIPATQTIAAMFMVSTAFNMIRTLWSKSPEKGILELIDHLKKPGPRELINTKVWTFFLGWFVHGIGMFLLWQEICPKIGIGVPQEVSDVIAIVVTTALLTSTLYCLQHTIFGLLDKKAPVSVSPEGCLVENQWFFNS